MRQIAIEVSDQTLAAIDAAASEASVSREQFVSDQLQRLAARCQEKAARDATVTAEYDAYAASVDTALSPAERARRYAKLREVEW